MSGANRRIVHVIVPDWIDDPARPSGGNAYDRRTCTGLVTAGWDVHEHAVDGSWPRPTKDDDAALAQVVADIPDGSTVLIDGLIASVSPAVLVPASRRLVLVVLVHTILSDEREHAVFSAASALVGVSEWTRDQLLAQYPIEPGKVQVAAPGVDAAELAAGTERGSELLCVAAVTPHKGQDMLLSALATVADVPWQCALVGTLDRDPDFVARVRAQAVQDGIAERISLPGTLVGPALDRTYAEADALVLASQAETYGLVITEALARGLPVIATAVGGVPEALGVTSAGERPGLLVPPNDRSALAAALRRWLHDADLRRLLRRAARERRAMLSGWPVTIDRIAAVLGGTP